MENTNNENSITVEDLLRQTKKELSEIKLPGTNLTTSVELYQNVSIPVARAIDAIDICIKVFEQAKTLQENKNKEEEVDDLTEGTDTIS